MQLSPQIFIATVFTLVAIGCSSPRTVPRAHGAATMVLLTKQQEIELALSAAPVHLRAEASVYTFGRRGYSRVRAGSNGFTCLVNRDGHQRGESALRPTCWDAEGSATIVPIVLKVGEMVAQGKTAVQIEQTVEAGFREGSYKSPGKTGIAYMLRGDVEYNPQTQQMTELFPAHYMIYAPGVSNADIGMSEQAFSANPSLPVVYSGYSGGARTAYIIIIASEGEDRAH